MTRIPALAVPPHGLLMRVLLRADAALEAEARLLPALVAAVLARAAAALRRAEGVARQEAEAGQAGEAVGVLGVVPVGVVVEGAFFGEGADGVGVEGEV